jgi:hypothetical protein
MQVDLTSELVLTRNGADQFAHMYAGAPVEMARDHYGRNLGRENLNRTQLPEASGEVSRTGSGDTCRTSCGTFPHRLLSTSAPRR